MGEGFLRQKVRHLRASSLKLSTMSQISQGKNSRLPGVPSPVHTHPAVDRLGRERRRERGCRALLQHLPPQWIPATSFPCSLLPCHDTGAPSNGRDAHHDHRAPSHPIGTTPQPPPCTLRPPSHRNTPKHTSSCPNASHPHCRLSTPLVAPKCILSLSRQHPRALTIPTPPVASQMPQAHSPPLASIRVP